MSGFSELLDRTFFTIGGTRVTLGGLQLLFLIATAALAASWILQRLIARGARAAFPQLDVHLDPEALAAILRAADEA